MCLQELAEGDAPHMLLVAVNPLVTTLTAMTHPEILRLKCAAVGRHRGATGLFP
jgi:hypothetical protein